MSRFNLDLLNRALAYAGKPQPVTTPSVTTSYSDFAIQVALELIRRFEGFYSHPYLCPAGVPTIGYGATHYLDGRRVTLSDAPISRETAERLAFEMVKRTYLPIVLRLCPNVRDPKRLAMLIDFCFNLGGKNLEHSTLRRKVNDDLWDEVPAQLRRWIYANGKALKGLILRREEEIKLI